MLELFFDVSIKLDTSPVICLTLDRLFYEEDACYDKRLYQGMALRFGVDWSAFLTTLEAMRENYSV